MSKELIERYEFISKRIDSLLEELEEFFDGRADADQPDDRNPPQPNEELILLDKIMRFKEIRRKILAQPIKQGGDSLESLLIWIDAERASKPHDWRFNTDRKVLDDVKCEIQNRLTRARTSTPNAVE